MMNATSYCVFACVAILVSQAMADDDQCTYVSHGTSMNAPTSLPDVFLAAGTRDWTVTITDTPCAVVQKTVAIVCDQSVKPTASFVSSNVVYVHRNNDLSNNAVVHVNVYCA